MNVLQKIRAVERVFKSLDKEIDQFKASSGINCVAGCGACCKKPDIEASVLEFLPLAYRLYKTGQADEILDLLDEESDRRECVFFSPVVADASSGFCSQYQHRGLICRLFGYSAMRNKSGALELVTCRKIKETMPDLFAKANDDIKRGLKIPVISQYYYRLYPIDMNLSGKLFPINQAIRLAIETVAMYFYYNAPKAS